MKALKTVQATVQTFDERLSSLEKKTKDSQSETEDDDEEDDGKGKETEDDILEAEQAQNYLNKVFKTIPVIHFKKFYHVQRF